VLIYVIYKLFHCFLSVYTQYLWPISLISPMQCFYRPHTVQGRCGLRQGTECPQTSATWK